MTINVDLGPDGEATVARLVENGTFPSADAVLRKGVELLLVRDEALARLKAASERAEHDQAHGLLIDAEDAFDEMDARIAERFKSETAAA